MTDLDFFHKQTQELKKIKEEIFEDTMSYMGSRFSSYDVDEEEVRNYLQMRLSRHQLVISSHTRDLKRGNSDPELNSMAIQRRCSTDSFDSFDFDDLGSWTSSDSFDEKVNTRECHPAGDCSPSSKRQATNCVVGMDDSSYRNTDHGSGSYPISDNEDLEAPMNGRSSIPLGLPLKVYSEVEVVGLSTNSHASLTGTIALSDSPSSQDRKENRMDQNIFNNSEVSIYFYSDDASSCDTGDDDSEGIIRA
jgi:hypothetical protein